MQVGQYIAERSGKFLVNDVRIFMPLIDIHPHLFIVLACLHNFTHAELPVDLSECAQTRKDTSPNPRAVFSFWWCKDLDPHILHCQSLHLME